MNDISSWTRSVGIPNCRTIDFTSAVNQRKYRLLIGVPQVSPPNEGYRVLYLLDGNRYFGSVTEAVRNNYNAPDVLVVGIGYPDDEAFIAASIEKHGPPSDQERDLPAALLSLMRERTFDMTLPVPRGHAFPGIPEDVRRVGGLDDFLAVIERDIKSRVAELAPISSSDTTIFGHSLGGLAVLHALLTRPETYKNYISASPSIWWADRAVLKGVRDVRTAFESNKLRARLLVTMGADEATPLRLPPGRDPEEAGALLRYANMLENGRNLVERLQSSARGTGLEVADYAVFPHQGHGISVWPAIGRAVQFAFQS